MSEEFTRHTGVVQETLPGLKFKVLLNNGSEVIAYPSGKMRHFAGKILLGDKVRVELSPYDFTQGRIIRNK